MDQLWANEMLPEPGIDEWDAETASPNTLSRVWPPPSMTEGQVLPRPSSSASGSARRSLQRSPHPALADDIAIAEAVVVPIDRPLADGRCFATAPREAEGVELHVSARSSTGYRGVAYYPGSRATSKPYQAFGPGREKKFLGCFSTAVEAAVAYANFVAAPKAAPKVETTVRPQHLPREAEGITLHMSARNTTTGYKGVTFNAQIQSKPFQTYGPGPQNKFLGCFATAVEGAVAYARYIASPESPDGTRKEVLEAAMQLLPDVPIEAEGMKLHISTRSGTGCVRAYAASLAQRASKRLVSLYRYVQVQGRAPRASCECVQAVQGARPWARSETPRILCNRRGGGRSICQVCRITRRGSGQRGAGGGSIDDPA